MGTLEGRIAVVTGAGRGLGREHALLLAAEGASVVVNDLGGGPGGQGSDAGPAAAAVAEIEAAGGHAVANSDDVATWAGAERLIACAIESFGDLDILVNNAGVLRDRMIVSVSEEEWDVVVRVCLKGTAAPTKFAAAHWRAKAKAGQAVHANVVNTSSESGVFAAVGQSNYAAAKSAVATLTQLWAKELAAYGVKVNAVLPRARTRLTEGVFGDVVGDDRWEPGNVSPFVTYLASNACRFSGEAFIVGGSVVQRVRAWEVDPEWRLDGEGRWTVGDITAAANEMPEPKPLLPPPGMDTW